MVRELRPRKSRPTYHTLLEVSGDELERNHDLGLSEDEFKLEDEIVEDDAVPESLGETEEDELLSETSTGQPIAGPSKTKPRKTRGRVAKVPATPRNRPLPQPPVLSRPTNRQNYALPTPAPDHRYRSGPLYRHSRETKRLLLPPTPFQEPTLKDTNNWTVNPNITDRYSKASGYNIGPGPLWQLIEDRSWWKESRNDGDDKGSDGSRRPRVYAQVQLENDMSIVDEQYVHTIGHGFGDSLREDRRKIIYHLMSRFKSRERRLSRN